MEICTDEGSVTAHGGHGAEDKHEDVGHGSQLGGKRECRHNDEQRIGLQPEHDPCEESAHIVDVCRHATAATAD